MLKKIRNMTLLATLLSLSVQSYALPLKDITQLYFFGDSLTDSGFNDLWPTIASPPQVPILPAGKAPTFTSGYTWAQYVARDIKGLPLPGAYPNPQPADTLTNNSIYARTPITGFVSGTLQGSNYAAGGSRTHESGVSSTVWAPSLQQQIAYYLSGAEQTLDPQAIYFIWSGANDLLGLLFSAPPFPTQEQFLVAANAAAISITSEVAALSARGAKRIVVLNLPNLGVTPLMSQLAALYQLPTLPNEMQALTVGFNTLLSTELNSIDSTSETKVLYIDIYSILGSIIESTKAGQPYQVAGHTFLFTNYTEPACAPASSALYCPSNAPTHYIFADALHPTDMQHQLLALFVEMQIEQWG